MRADGSLPSYDTLFGELELRAVDESRSVYSPAAYLADLIQLAEDCATDVKNNHAARLGARRPDLAEVPLDGLHSYTEIPYLDVVNDVLAKRLAGGGGGGGADVYETLAGLRYPFVAPFSLGHERLRQILRHLDVDPVDLYRRFSPDPDPDVVAREYLGLSAADVAMVTTVLADGPELRDCYHLDDTADAFEQLAAADRFRHAAGLSGAELRELVPAPFLSDGGVAVALDADGHRLVAGDGAAAVPVGWFDRANRFVRLARRTELSFADLGLVLHACTGDRIDLAGLRTLAVVLHLRRALELTTDEVVRLVAPLETAGDLAGSGDILGAGNAEHRRRVAAAVGLAERDVVAVVVRCRDRRVGTVFARPGTGLAEVSLLHRIGRLTAALEVSVADLFAVLDALASDPSIQRFSTFPILIHTAADTVAGTGVRGTDYDRVLAGGDVGASLWLLQTLAAVVRWMQATGLSATDLTGVLGGPDEPGPLLDRLGEQFAAIEPTAELFESERFGTRAAQVIRDVVAEAATAGPGGSGRLLRVDPDRVTATVHAAVAELAVVAGVDFAGLGVADRRTDKIFRNLMLAGYLAAGGVLVPARIPEEAADLRLCGDFSAHAEAVFDGIAARCATGGSPTFFPSDLAALPDLTDAERAELYDNLIFNGDLDADGRVLRTGFFAEPANAAALTVDADLADVVDQVHEVLVGTLTRFAVDRPGFDPGILAGLPLDDQQRAALVDSLRFNGHLDAEDRYVDPDGLIDLPLADLRLAVQFHPFRRRVLDGMQAHLVKARAEAYALTPGDFAALADAATGQRVAALLADPYLRDGRPTEETVALLAEPEATLGLPGFTDVENATIAYQLRVIVADAHPFRLDLAELGGLGFTAEERRRLVAQLIDDGHLDQTLAVPVHRIDYFSYAPNAADFALPGLADFSTDIFFLLHAVATRLAAAIAELTGVLARVSARQRTVLIGTLQDELGVPAGTAEAICAAVAGSLDHALSTLVEPVLDNSAAAAADPDLRRALRRMRGFARFAGALALTADEVTVAFTDQDLTGKFAEPLALPSGADRIDALLHSADGTVYLFHGAEVWVYSAAGHALIDRLPRSLAALSPALAALSAVDTAFTDAEGAEWIVGRDAEGVPLTFVRRAGHPRWLRREQQWGVVANAFDDATRIDAAFVDDGGRTYLFHRDQYVRYSGDGHTHVDEGYPRRIGDWWETEQRTTQVPARFRDSLDAAFHGRDDTTYLFAGDSFLAVRDGAAAEPVTGTWGRVVDRLAETGRVDAAYVDGPHLYVFAGNQVTRYSAGIEHGGVRADEGYPRRIEAHLGDVPAEFEGGVEAAFVDADGCTHLFKDGRTVALQPGRSGTGTPTAQRWGRLHPALPTGGVDAALVGPDGHTYLFSGDTYLRYSGADYSVVDVGYPRRIAGDWDGLRQVGAAFVQDGATFLFGAAGQLFDLSIGSDATELTGELSAGRLPWTVRQRLLALAITVADDATVTGSDPSWQVTAERGIRLMLRRAGERLEVHCDPGTPVTFHVRYSTTDLTVADPGYPRPLTDNFWNLPESLVGDDAAFATVDAVLTGPDHRTYLFSGDRFIVHDNKRRWWSEPQTLAEHWDSVPFDRVDAAFVGVDGRTYLFSGNRYVRYSTGDYTRVDDRYPATVTPFWGNVANTIARTGRVDAVLATGEHTYLFSGDQFVRYTRTPGERPYFADLTDPGLVDLGYPRKLGALRQEPRLGNLRTTVDSVSAAFADRATVYLFSGEQCVAVSGTAYRRYDDLATDAVGCAFVEDGAVLVEHPDGWRHYGALEGTTIAPRPVRPRLLRAVPAPRRTGVDAVLAGTDGNTYLFHGSTCVNVDLGKEYPLAEEWGRPRNAVHHDNAVDAAFVGSDGHTYLFRDDQFLVYHGDDYVEAVGEPQTIAEHWGGLRRVALAYVRDGVTYLFEPPAEDGTIRYAAWSGADYGRPDDGFPATTDASFWAVPDQHRPDGFTIPQAVLFSGTSMLLVTGGSYLQYNEATDTWAYPRPLERIWRGLGPADTLTTAFTGRDGATYFFWAGESVRHDGRAAGAREPVRARWGRTHNTFLATGDDVVDAAVVHLGVTYLFAGDQYVRYSGPEYRYVDAGYPKTIVGNLRAEDAFADLPAGVEDDLSERYAAGSRSMIDAAVANDRTVYLFAGRTCHAVSTSLTAQYGTGVLGPVRNTIAERARVDAALVVGEHTYLFSGDQYVRYTGADHTRVDDGYPRSIAAGLPAELGIAALPDEFCDGIDAAFRAGDGRVYLFAGADCLSVADGTVTPIRGSWGTVRNEFRAERAGLDAAFVGSGGELYAFAGGQYVRYAPGRFATVDDGYPRRIRDNWGDLPAAFEQRVDGAFRFAGRTYLAHGDEYVRYTGDRLDAIDRTYPQPFAYRWCDAADYRLSDLRTIERFAALARGHRDADGGLAAFLLPDRRAVTDPFEHLAGLFGWDAEELKWCRRHAGLLTGGDSDRLELEFLLALVDVFALAGRLGTGPSRGHSDVWARLHAGAPDPHGAADALHRLLELRTGPQQWPALARQLHDGLNLRKRDALVATVLATDGGTPRDLFERFLVDVEMGADGNTSKVREAIAAAQLYLHRYLLNLELADAGEETRQRVKTWWRWMRNYRVWEANRKVFLYPENYLRPELRPTKTPAFVALESDLLQGEITPDAVERAYKRYLDEYTEVSRLTIAGGYVYTKDRAPDGPQRLVLFGRTKTDPRRYYHRRAEFATRDKLSATWEPWQPVDVQIDADQVHPIHAFGRVFVFWVVTEPVAEDATTVVAQSDGDQQWVSSRGNHQRIRILYSFQNLTKEWVPAQTLATGVPEDGMISDATLLLLPQPKDGDQMSILVSCSYTVTTPADPAAAGDAAGDAAKPTTRQNEALFELNPQLYAVDLLAALRAAAPEHAWLLTVRPRVEGAIARAATADRVARVFVDKMDAADVVRFDAPAGSDFWFSVDHQGGSFLCRPVRVTGTDGTRLALAGNQDRLPAWSTVDAAVETPDHVRYFFDNAQHRYLVVKPTGRTGSPEPIAGRWGRVRTVLAAPGDVDAVLLRGEETYVLSGDGYVRFTGTPFGSIDEGYPKPLAGNPDDLPGWRPDVAFSGPDGVDYCFNHTARTFVTSAAPDRQRPVTEFWGAQGPPDGFARFDAAVVTDAATFLLAGDRYLRFDHGARPKRKRPARGGSAAGESVDWTVHSGPHPLPHNGDGLPWDFPVAAGVTRDGVTYWFDNAGHRYTQVAPDGARVTRPTYVPSPAVARTQTVDAAWVAAGRLYLTTGREYVRYTLHADGSVPDLVDDGYPAALPRSIDAAFRRDDDLYLFTGDRYTRIDADQEPAHLPEPRPTAGAWGELPRTAPAGTPPFDAALDSESGLYLFDGDSYVRYTKTLAVRRPFELASLPFEIIRLTSGTASALNQKLLSGGVPALLDLSTQETDEAAVTTDPAATAAIRVRPGLVDASRLPTGSHLDFRSANGLYYWEIFCHAPLLIAQALNGAQRFEDARRWYEYVFDPTHPGSYWRFLPFLAVDLDALAGTLTGDLARVRDLGLPAEAVEGALAPVITALRTLIPVMAHNREPATEQERAALLTATGTATHAAIAEALAALRARPGLTAGQHDAIAGLSERTLVAAGLAKQFDVLGDRDALLGAYRDDPFDPHAIADLRPVAYRRAVVMAYIDNLLDWADLLFRQYTPESVDEARMLYVLAYDLLGARPERLGTQLLPRAESFAELDAAPGALDLVGYLTSGGAMVTGPGAVHAGVADAYFDIPGNSVFDEYWVRVEDRLRKIRHSLNIMGISQPLPLFAPPIDPMALVRSVATGGELDPLTTGVDVAVPHYRFAFVFRKAQDLVDKLRQLSADLLGVLERGNAEELCRLQNRQEREIFTLTRAIRTAQVTIAEKNLAELIESRDSAQARAVHYATLIDKGMGEKERAQVGLMSTASGLHFGSAVLKVAAGIAYAVPQCYVGPFIVGVDQGGRQLGSSIDKAAETAESLGEGFGMIGEVMGVQAQFERMTEDWQLQLATATSEVTQLGHRIAGAELQVGIARQEAAILDREIAHNESVATFLKDKFTNAELYGWMSGTLSGLYFQAYRLAYDMARAAERAYHFERGVAAGESTTFVRPVYWQNRRAGLLAGESLGLDLERLGAAYLDGGGRGLEITRQVSLRDLDPIALLRLRDAGAGEFALPESLFDYDFPGHYRRQIRTVTVTFLDADGRPLAVNATLTQLGHTTVLEPDPPAVKHLLDPKGAVPAAVRSDWRASQQIALSQPDGGRDNNGLFELRFDDDRYLPFEGTGAVSRWRLARGGRPVRDLFDVVVTVKYTAEQGGEVFANAVRGLLRPAPAARLFDLARDFTQEWEEFLAGDGRRLVLPFTADMFPDLAGQQITGIYPTYDLAGDAAARLLLDGDATLALAEGKLLPTPGRTLRSPWSFAVDGARDNLRNVGLVLTYHARVQ